MWEKNRVGSQELGVRSKNKKIRFLVYFFILLFLTLSSQLLTPNCYAASIVNSKHNLSVSGPGQVKSVTESEICVFCHTPHRSTSDAPLWNRYDSGQIYIPYTSTTLKASVGQPTGASKLCLSCHDGTVALGLVRSRSDVIPFTQSIGPEDNLGTDLSNDHPVSFIYDSALASLKGQLKNPLTLTGAVRLDKESRMQCASCHDPHDDQFGNFLRQDTRRGSLCLACHDTAGWDTATHKNSSSLWNGSLPNPWPHTSWNSMTDNACENCHDPHNALGKKRLLNSDSEEDNCLPCHNGNVAKANIMTEFSKASNHPIYASLGLHDPAENAIITSSRHVECVDCHNQHKSNGVFAGSLPGSLKSVRGVSAQGLSVNEIISEYELCYRCHADSNYAAKTYVNRQFSENNTRVEFDSVNKSYHPVLAIGKNPDGPSLIAPYTTSSIIKCSDCHNNNSGANNGGTGSRGPHGSIYKPLLERNLVFVDYQSESQSTYALCYKCHDRNSILANKSFSRHRRHIVSIKSPCTACHDPHGVKDNNHLINFDRNIVSKSTQGALSYTDTGRFRGRCSLKCHGVNHNNTSY